MGALFGGGGGGGRPSPVEATQAAAAPTGLTASERERRRRIGRSALVRTDQENVLQATTGRNVLTAV